ncbi:transcriptional regulator family: Fungal Specific TF [Penicillium argentinense]|uniref:Transcriptional regulator family: Fungal Specific TF n=1 Tax=Penicillium argentinense TaxID=1131581 RepID=A0A9W9G2P5_9EURO|nr:transcriptional regulator family: Fungal Specific TF [Penicillium argentinense]KAJ5111010.1 transcriptional regulator family: Fungal Specific TF [Penicillium argentinense]
MASLAAGSAIKVKCDREDPCMNCVDARAECLRTRQSRVHRPRVSRLDAIAERLAKLERTNEDSYIFSSPPETDDTSRTTASSPRTKLTDSAWVSAKRKLPSILSHHESPSGQPELKRRMSHNIDPKTHNERHSPDATRHASEAREYIEHELQCNLTLSQDRRTTLEMARKFVGQLSNPGLHGQKVGAGEHLEIADNLGPPTLTPEMLYMMLPGPDKKTNSQGTYVWPDHISDKTLERMGLAIIEGSESEHVLHLYRISVWVKALSCISKMAPMISSEPLRVHFRALKKQYEAAAVEELDSISLTAAPSLALLQALLSGKRLMQYLGNMSRCWMFTALASRIIVALNYHNITDPIPRNEVEEDIHACVYTCYYFDKTLSVLLLRPPSLPVLKVEPVKLIHMDPDLPTTPMIRGIVEYAHIKSTLVDILLDSNKEMREMDKASVLSNLVARAHAIYSDLQKYRNRQELEFPDSWGNLRCEWLSMDFNYYSVLATIIRARSSVLKSRLVCEDCLYAARKALTTLRALQEAFSSRATSVDSYPYFLTWTMLLFPLSPFFILFCNVVATSDQRDFEMIKKITDDLRQFAKANASIGKLYGLFSKFLDLCAPLIKANSAPLAAASSSFVAEDSSRKAAAQIRTSNSVTFGRGSAQAMDLPSPVATNNRVAHSGGVTQPMEGWDDSLMWELFDNQPSLGWAESELWDALTQLSS